MSYFDLKSFVKRNGRMTEFQRKSWEACAKGRLIELSSLEKGLSCFEEQSRPLIVEIGFGMGENILFLAEQYPECNILAVDVYRPGIGALLGHLASHAHHHVRVIEGDAKEVLRLLPLGSCQNLHIFFPDPWPKKRHHKRRLIQKDLLGLVEQVLMPGGILYIATDHASYAEHIEDCLKISRLEAVDLDHKHVRCLTKYEARGKRLGHDIVEFSAKRLGDQSV